MSGCHGGLSYTTYIGVIYYFNHIRTFPLLYSGVGKTLAANIRNSATYRRPLPPPLPRRIPLYRESAAHATLLTAASVVQDRSPD